MRSDSGAEGLPEMQDRLAAERSLSLCAAFPSFLKD